MIKKTKFIFLFLALLLVTSSAAASDRYLYDSQQVRYELYQTNEGAPFNWLFLPGGPGIDSCYLRSLVDELDLPGNVWLIDLPGNGSHLPDFFHFDEWFTIFPEVIKKFENPILVGHSFGGMFPLLFPELENHLKGFVILNSAPSLWEEEASAYAKQFDLPDLTDEIHAYMQNPNQKTFNAALNVCMPYYFPDKTLEKGRKLFAQAPFPYQAAIWWQNKAIELNFSAKWVPRNVPTLIVGAKYDFICPLSLFRKDQRFQRDNINMIFIEDAGHFTWIENPEATKKAFKEIVSKIQTR